MMKKTPSKWLFVSAISLHTLITSALPVEETLEPRDEPLEARGDSSAWVPDGGPEMKPDETVTSWLTRVIDTENSTENRKRDSGTSLFGNPNLHLDTTPFKSTLTWDDTLGDVDTQYTIVTVDGHCDQGLKPNSVIGPVVKADGTEVQDAQVHVITDELLAIAEKHDNLDERFRANYAFLKLQMDAAEKDVKEIIGTETGKICPPPPTDQYPWLSEHDELRRLLAVEKDVQTRRLLAIEKKKYYYLVSLLTSTAGGAVIAGVQAGITKGTAPGVQLGWEAWLNSAVGYAMGLFITTEMSRFAPSLAGGQAFGPVAFWAWLRQVWAKNRQKLGRLGGGGAAAINRLASEASQNSGNGNSQTSQNTGTGNSCVDPNTAQEGLNQMAGVSDATADMMRRGGFAFAGGNDVNNIVSGANTCKQPTGG